MSDEPTIDVEIPPGEEMPWDVGMQPTAKDETSFSIMGGAVEDRPDQYFEKVEVREDSLLNRQLLLKLTSAQMRRWVDLFDSQLHQREQQLDDTLGEAWGMYTVTINEYPPRTAPEEQADIEPITSEVVATCWTPKAANEVRYSIQAGEHPEYDFLDPSRGTYAVEIDVVPLIGEGQDPPWEE